MSISGEATARRPKIKSNEATLKQDRVSELTMTLSLKMTEGDMPKAPPDFIKWFRAILVEEERALADRERAAQMKNHARLASELHAAGNFDEADAELRKAEALEELWPHTSRTRSGSPCCPESLPAIGMELVVLMILGTGVSRGLGILTVPKEASVSVLRSARVLRDIPTNQVGLEDYQSPRKNFGVVLTIGALEAAACRPLAVGLMRPVGIR